MPDPVTDPDAPFTEDQVKALKGLGGRLIEGLLLAFPGVDGALALEEAAKLARARQEAGIRPADGQWPHGVGPATLADRLMWRGRQLPTHAVAVGCDAAARRAAGCLVASVDRLITGEVSQSAGAAASDLEHGVVSTFNGRSDLAIMARVEIRRYVDELAIPGGEHS